MKYIYLPGLLAIGLLFWVITYQPLMAQKRGLPDSLACGTIALTPAQRLLFVQQAKMALQRKGNSRKAFTDITYVPIRPHIIRRWDGTGGYPLAKLNEAMATTNRYFLQNGFGIQFYFAGLTPDYIDDSALYESFSYPPADRDSHDALNQYYINVFAPDIPYSGLANFPADDVTSTRSYIRTYGDNGQDFHFGDNLIPHELGHNFGLYHTFGFGSGNTPTDELVTRGPGANCETAGDFICDTPADPYGMPGSGMVVINGCYQYNPSNTLRDANGDLYAPSVTNHMSYYSAATCTRDFTPGQYERIQAGLALRQGHTSYRLNAPTMPVTPPGNLVATVNGLSVALTWQDNSDSEMGYFIERSNSPTTGFVSVGGVAPDVTTYTDSMVTLDGRYYYRIRPSNTTTGNLSSTIAVAMCQTPYSPGSTPFRIAANLHWSSNMDQTYTIRWRAVGTTTWNLINSVALPTFNSPFSLTGLTSQTTYEWQVQGACSPTTNSDFTELQTFTTLSCQGLYGANVGNIGGASVVFSWYSPYDEPGRTAEIRYRVAGTPTWTTISSLSSAAANSTYTLTGLTNNTTYEWQFRNTCSPNEPADYTPLATFTTLCRIPTGLFNTPTATQAMLGWTVTPAPDAATTYEIQYRSVGNSAWNSSDNSITSNNYSLTGLSPNMPYEWRVRTACSANSQSDYSPTKQFTTICNPPNAYGLNVLQITSTSVQLNCYVSNDVGTQYDIRYRIVGGANWLTTSVNSTNTFGGGYLLAGLTNNTSYEWQIRSVCSPTDVSAFITGPNFTTQCQVPPYLYASPQVTSTVLNWGAVGNDVTYEIRYLLTGTTGWTTISNVTSASVNITGLTSNTSYECQVRTRCQDGITTDFTALVSFTTRSCNQPTGLHSNMITANSAQLYWNAFFTNDDTHYEIRYRAIGATDWLTQGNLSGNNGIGSLVLTGLSSNTSYMCQIRTLCSATESSDFTSPVTFKTLPPCPSMYSLKAGLWNDATIWSCGRVPLSSDIVQLKHAVIIPASYPAQVKQINYDAGQRLIVGTSGSLRFGQ